MVRRHVALRLLSPDGMSRRILIVEDDVVLRRQIRRVLAMAGYEVAETDSIADFVAVASRFQFDACLLDLWLPDGNGLDAWERVRSSQGGAVAVLMSGQPTPGLSERAASVGCRRFLAKPFDLSTLLEACGAVSTVRQVPARSNFSIR